jgi:hypothetical protein
MNDWDVGEINAMQNGAECRDAKGCQRM